MPCSSNCAHIRAAVAAGEFREFRAAAAPEARNDLEGFARADAVKHYAPNITLEPVHMDIALVFDFPNHAVDGTVTHTVRCNASVPTAAALGDAAMRLTLNAVGFDSVHVTGDKLAGFECDGKEIVVRWAEPFAAKGDERKITVTYRVEKPVSGLFFNSADLPSNGTYAVTDHETERARYWLPCVDFPTVRPRLTFRLTAPANFETLANGALVSSTVDANDAAIKTTVWDLDFPCPSYLLFLAVGDFNTIDDRPAVTELGEVPIKYYAPKGFAIEDLGRALDTTPAMYEWLTKKIAPMPWPKYSQLMSPWIGGAMENQSSVSWGSFATVDETHARDSKFNIDATNIHEMAHSLFTVVRFFEHAWLKESWATYLESVWVEEHVGATPEEMRDRARLYRFDDAEAYISEADGDYMRPIVNRRFDHSWSMFDGHLYMGGGARLHMLRGLLGDDVFWPAVSEYVRRYTGKTVETDDFRKVLEEFSGLNLTRFFDQWFHSKGYPKFKATYAFDEAKGVAHVALEQTQADAAEGIPLFAMDVPVEFATADGAVHRAVASFDGNSAKAVAAAHTGAGIGGKPVRVEVDPDGFQMFAFDGQFNPGHAILLATAAGARDCVNRIRAFRTLLKTADYYTLRKVRPLALAEPMPLVRAKIAAALGGMRHAPAVELLIELAARETDDTARKLIFGRLNFKHPLVAKFAHATLADPKADLTYMQRAALLTAIATQRRPEDFALVAAYAAGTAPGFTDYKGIVRAAAFRALPSFRSVAAAEVLLAQHAAVIRGDFIFNTKTGLVSGLASAAAWVPEPLARTLAEAIVEALDDPHFLVREVATSAIARLPHGLAAEFAAAAEAVLVLAPEQDQQPLKDTINRARRGAGNKMPAVAALTKRVEELEKSIKEVEGKWLAKDDAEKQVKEAKEAAEKKE
ncbi:hypothetical protein H9P43_002914 [Blastocladiella emersonii ATCC 22665]|nr:hypothetical protein H9P43_002914 [Blastocladiella emersonii ATCC 22665]